MPILLIFDACFSRWESGWSLYAPARGFQCGNGLGGSLGEPWSPQFGRRKLIGSARSGCAKCCQAVDRIIFLERRRGLWGIQRFAHCAASVIWTLRVRRTLYFARRKRISWAHCGLADCGGRAPLYLRMAAARPVERSAVGALCDGCPMGSLERLNALVQSAHA
jgi:hypothetical protein